MIFHGSSTALGIFFFFVAIVLGLSFYLGSKAKSAKGYYAAHGQIHWFINGIAFAGDYLSAASFLGICGMIASSGYDGFLYSIGFLAGWVVALFVVAEPLRRMGKFTFADALDSRFHSRGIKLAAAISTLVVSTFYLIPQMVGAGKLITPLLGFDHYVGVLLVGGVVTVIVATAGMVSTTYVQFIKGSMLVIFCLILTLMILNRGLKTNPGTTDRPFHAFAVQPESEVLKDKSVLPEEGDWVKKPYVRVKDAAGKISVWRIASEKDGVKILSETQTVYFNVEKKKVINGEVQSATHDFYPVGNIGKLPDGKSETGPLGPTEFFGTLNASEVVLWGSEKIKEPNGELTVYYQKPTPGSKLLVPGAHPMFKGLREEKFMQDKNGKFTGDKLDFLSLMLALFCGTASLPHILIRYYTVKDQAAVRKSTVVGIASIGFFYVLTLFLGLGAMTSGMLDPTDSGYAMAAPLLARSFGELPFAVISAIAFTTVLGTVSGLIMAASGAVAHDLMTNFLKMDLNDHDKVRAGKFAAVVVGVIAMALGILFKDLNPSFLVGWAFNVAASANLPALTMLLFWKGTTKQGITASVIAGMVTSLLWILLSGDTYDKVYHWPKADAPMPFSQPGLVTIPLSYVVLIVVSLMTQKTGTAEAIAQQKAAA